MENKLELLFVSEDKLNLKEDPIDTQYLMRINSGKYVLGKVCMDRNSGNKYISNCYEGYKYAKLV